MQSDDGDYDHEENVRGSGSSSGPHEKMEGMSLNSDVIVRERDEVSSKKEKSEDSIYKQNSEESEGIMTVDNHLNQLDRYLGDIQRKKQDGANDGQPAKSGRDQSINYSDDIDLSIADQSRRKLIDYSMESSLDHSIHHDLKEIERSKDTRPKQSAKQQSFPAKIAEAKSQITGVEKKQNKDNKYQPINQNTQIPPKIKPKSKKRVENQTQIMDKVKKKPVQKSPDKKTDKSMDFQMNQKFQKDINSEPVQQAVNDIGFTPIQVEEQSPLEKQPLNDADFAKSIPFQIDRTITPVDIKPEIVEKPPAGPPKKDKKLNIQKIIERPPLQDDIKQSGWKTDRQSVPKIQKKFDTKIEKRHSLKKDKGVMDKPPIDKPPVNKMPRQPSQSKMDQMSVRPSPIKIMEPQTHRINVQSPIELDDYQQNRKNTKISPKKQRESKSPLEIPKKSNRKLSKFRSTKQETQMENMKQQEPNRRTPSARIVDDETQKVDSKSQMQVALNKSNSFNEINIERQVSNQKPAPAMNLLNSGIGMMTDRQSSMIDLGQKEEEEVQDVKQERKSDHEVLNFDNKEVDFHHQIAFRFEKSARLRENKKPKDIVKAANQEIIMLIKNHQWIIQIDPMILFYCLYFSVYYRNKEILDKIVEIIQEMSLTNYQDQKDLNQKPGSSKLKMRKRRMTIHKSNLMTKLDQTQQIRKIDELMTLILLHGIDRLSNNSDTACQEFFHIVFYQAIDDNMRLVYYNILLKLKEINLRDSDALHFIKQRDWQIIEKSFKKTSKGLFTGLMMHKKYADQVSRAYKTYNRAYYQEIIVKNDQVEGRTKFLFNQRFLKSADDIDQVLEMYCRVDDLEQFAKFIKEIPYSAQRVEQLWLVCIKSDSMKIAFHLSHNYNIMFNQTVITALSNSIRDSQWYFEIKLFYIRQFFSFLNVAQMNDLLDLFQTIFDVHNPKLHPLVNCYNPVKCSLLVYEICWKIQQKNIYSLQRTCDKLMNYLKESLDRYFNFQGNINHLYRLMREPILHQREQQDSMDLMLIMDIDDLIQHKVVEEVLNLVYDGKYSIDTSPLYLSSLQNTIVSMSTFSPKSVFKRLINNINTMGAWRFKKQSSIQFHVWKQCIRQRETDEMIFMCIVSFILILMAVLINQDMSTLYSYQQEAFEMQIYGDTEELFKGVSSDVMKNYCVQDQQYSLLIYQNVQIVKNLSIFCSISYIASVFSKVLTSLTKQNVHLDPYEILFEGLMIYQGFYLNILLQMQPTADILSTTCGQLLPDLTAESRQTMDLVYYLLKSPDLIISFQHIMTVIIIQHCINILSMLRRTENIGPSIIMMVALRQDLSKFFIAFFLPIIAFLIIGVFNSAELTTDTLNSWNIFIQLFSAFTGEQDFSAFQKYAGQSYLVLFIMLYFVLLLNLLIAMFSNTYQRIYENRKAIRLRRILDMKNQLGHDPIIGAVSSTFFPINFTIILFMPIVIVVKNKKLNELINKWQYAFMIFLQTAAISVFQIFLSPVMYVKMVVNSFHIMIISQNNQTGIERYLEPFFSIIASPFIIVISILVDIFSLPSILLRSESEFEEKYQRNVDELNEEQIRKVNAVFQTVLFDQWKKYKGQYVTYFELMSMHRSKFKILKNLNDLLCKGSKDYKESLSSVQDFNSTKIMSRICSVPSKNGDITQNRIYFDMLKIINLDIVLFNHVFDIFNGGEGLHAIHDDDSVINGDSGFGNLQQARSQKKVRAGRYSLGKAGLGIQGGVEAAAGDALQMAAEDEDEENVADQYFRDLFDVMSFYQTNMLCAAFTNIEKLRLNDNELLVETKVRELYENISEQLRKEECETVEKMHDVLLKQSTNYRAQKMLVDQEPVSVQYFMAGILQEKGAMRDDTNCDDQMPLDYDKDEADDDHEETKPVDQEIQEINEKNV